MPKLAKSRTYKEHKKKKSNSTFEEVKQRYIKTAIINKYTFTKECDGILKIPTAGSIFSSLEKATSG